MSNIFGKVSEGSSGFIQPFSSTTYLDGGRDFLNSNSIVAKFSFLILILIGFMFIIRLSVSFMSWGFMPSYTPVLINGMVEAKQMLTFPQDPTVKGSKPIMRSVNDNGGLEFTWSVWIFVDDFSYKQNEYKHIFHKGNDSINSDGRAFPNNGPGLYITPKTNNLLVIMNSFNKIDEEVIIQRTRLLGEYSKRRSVVIGLHHSHTADQYGHLRTSECQQMSAVDEQVLCSANSILTEVVTEPISLRLKHCKRRDVCLLLRGIGATGGEGNSHGYARLLCGNLDCCATRKHDEIRQRNGFLATCCGLVVFRANGF